MYNYSLETSALSRRFSRTQVLKDLSLRVPEGSIYGFLVPNGAGKTTTLRLVMGPLKKQQGEINSFGRPFAPNRIASSVLVVVGSLLIPVLIIITRSESAGGLAAANRAPHVWEKLFDRNWQIMAAFLLPMGIVLVTSLITQLEFRNNTWKRLCTTPQSDAVIFFAKLAVILVMQVEFFVLSTIGIWLTGVIPPLFYRAAPYPLESLPLGSFATTDGKFLLDCLPIVALQYLLSLRFKNFLIPLGTGWVYMWRLWSQSIGGMAIPYLTPIVLTI